MAGQRMTRETFDAVVHERMKRYRVSMDQAMTDTLRELESPSTARRSMNDIDAGYRENQRYSLRDLPHSSVDRNWDMAMRRESFSDLPHHDMDRDPSGGRNLKILDRCVEPVGKERLYREDPNVANRRISEFEDLRSLNRGEFLPRSWEVDHPLHGSEILRDVHPSQSGDVFQTLGPVKLMSIKCGDKQGPVTQQAQRLDTKGSDFRKKNEEFNLRIVKWAKFSSKDDDVETVRYHKHLFKVKSEACKMMVDCFKGQMMTYYREMCFTHVRSLNHTALKSPKIDNELLDLLMATRTVSTKNDFFEVIKPFDKDMMNIQNRLIKCATPLLLASNIFELKYSLDTDPRLHRALENIVSMCRKSIVLIGQTFALISTARQNNVLEVLGVHESSLCPADYPNFKNFFLFGSDFILQLKNWLKNKANKLTLKSTTKPDVNTVKVVKTEEVKTSSAGKAADPKVIASIDKLLENAKKANQADKEKSPFWFLFDEGSNEYKYYRQKFVEFQNSKDQIHTQSTQTKKSKRSPEELACESVRAMLYARKAQAVKRRLYRTLSLSKKRKQAKLKSRKAKASPTVKAKKIIKAEKQELEIIPITETTTETSSCEADVKSLETPDQCSESAEVHKDKELQEDKEPLQEEVDEKTKDTAMKLAEFVAQMGPEIEQFSMENSVNNPEFWFLREKDSPAYKFYQSKLKEFKQTEVGTSDEEIGLEDTDLENIRTGDELLNDSDEETSLEMDAECEAAEAAESAEAAEAPSTEVIPVAAFSQMPTPARPLVTRKRVANLKVGMLPPKRVCLVEEPKVHEPVRIEYERPRGRGRGRKRFKKPVDLQYADKKLTQQNVGFQMLSKMGWQEGHGLGSHGSGIKNPINVGTISAGEGFGAEEKQADTSTKFDDYRHRMMAMYKKKYKNVLLV
ncbi:SURP and G-patch domain-containing protein 2 [Ranitomeya variabilis]|uniref:SURP and G-patch domain-containing protein 2 n=1 Tax=Ranitomeya variabilis TaxID=490064 RepID=UPI0040572D11